MISMKDMSIVEFAEATASGNAVPGGGSVAALCGSLAAALVEMVANLSGDGDKMAEISSMMKQSRKSLLDLIDRDSIAFTAVMDAYRLPGKDPVDKEIRSAAIQESLVRASKVPMETAELAFSIMEYSRVVVEKGNKNAVTDGAVSAMMAKTAVLASLLNVRINLSTIKDLEFVDHMNERATELESACKAAEGKILEGIKL